MAKPISIRGTCAEQPRPSTQFNPLRIAAALAGDQTAMRELVAAATPVVRRRVARTWLRSTGGRVRLEIDDLTQEVFSALFENDARALREWDPSLGLSFRNYVGLLAQRRAASMVRARGARERACECSWDSDAPPDALSETSPEETTESRELLAHLWSSLRRSLSERGFSLFERLFVHDDPIADVCAEAGMTPDALYQWRRRLSMLARAELSSLQADDADDP